MTDWSEEETDGSGWVTGAEEEEVAGGAAAMWAPRFRRRLVEAEASAVCSTFL